MFIGHFALGLAAKRVTPRTSLGMLLLAPAFADLLWPVFLLLGWEHVSFTPSSDPFLNLTFDSYPISHSLLTLAVWGVLLALLYAWRTRYTAGAVMAGFLVLSHWVLDWVTHRPDMPVWPGGPRVGLGLWNSVAGTIAIEGLMFIAGTIVYFRTTRAKDRVGRFMVWALLGLLALAYISSIFSPPPPTVQAIGMFAIFFGLLFVVWAAWGDRHREPITAE
jgi:FtsH-binding integral membrane protein